MNSSAVLIIGFVALGASAETGLELLGLLASVVSLGLAVRAARMGISMDDTCCVVRNLLRTRRVDLRDIDHFEFETNELMWSKNEVTVLRTTSGRGVRASGLILPVPMFLQGPGRERCRALDAELRKRR